RAVRHGRLPLPDDHRRRRGCRGGEVRGSRSSGGDIAARPRAGAHRHGRGPRREPGRVPAPLVVSDSVRLERDGHVGWLVFDNEPRRNALTANMLNETVDALADVAKDDDIRVVVLRGAGDKAFISGADISGFGSDTGIERSRTGPVEIFE